MKKKRKYRRIMKVFLAIAAAAAGALAVFLGIFYVPSENAEVVGSIRYSDQEIRQMVFTGFREHNSLYLAYRQKVVEPDVYFIDSIEVEYQGHNRVRLQVNEDMPIGYIEQDGYDYYFSSDGIVLEAMLLSENDPMVQSWMPEGTTQWQGNLSEAELSEVEQGMAEAVADTSFHAALTDVTRIEGLTDQKLKVGASIRTHNPAVFHTILALTKIFSKFDLKPDYITYNEARQLVLHYADVAVNIGGDSDLEAKMARIGVILPQLSGMQGTLHLETWTEDTVNIVFSPAEEQEESDGDDGETSSTDTDSAEGADGETENVQEMEGAEEFYQTFLSQAPGNSGE